VHHVAVPPALGNALAVLPDRGDGAARESELAGDVALALAALDLLDDLHLLFDREREPFATLRYIARRGQPSVHSTQLIF
jgi:hypothetical protein